ncbi:MAG: FGGY family carbohydrate kinase [Candidatus Limnocylindrales bacterium]
MARQLLLGIDEGTSGVKVVAYDLELRPIASARRSVTTDHPRAGWVEQDAEAVLAAVVDAVAEVLDVTDGDVVACGLDHQGESVVAWDAQGGAPLGPVIVWQDQRGMDVLARMSDAELAEIGARSGLPPDAYFSAASLGWLMTDGGLGARPGIRLGTLDAFLSDRLGAGFVTDASTASRTQLSGIVGAGADGWDPRLLDLFGVPEEALPSILDSAGDLGELRHPRWRQPLPLRARVVDQQASLAGTGCVAPGRAKATYGTGVFVLVHTGDAIAAGARSAGLLPTVAWRIGGRVTGALDGGVFSAGSMLEWLALDLGLAPDVPALLALAASVPDTGGVRILPALGGMGAPWWRPDARGVIAGLSGHTRPGHIARAALDAIAWRVGDIVRATDALAPVEDVRIDGGLTRAPGFAEQQATVLGRPVWRTDADATARGAAALAAVGAGILARIEDIDPLLPAFERVDPLGERPDAEAWIRFAEHAAELLD